jgi:DNA-binding transcriptional regulator YiaG
MNCVQCNQLLKHRVVPSYAYLSSGLSNLSLRDITTHHCPACGDTSVSFQCLGPLHSAVAHALVTKPTQLAPSEVRYLRDYLGWSNQEFAARMGVTQFHASRWTTKQPISGAAERLLRIFVLVGTKEALRKKDRKLQTAVAAFATEPLPGVSKLVARLSGKTWRVEVI